MLSAVPPPQPSLTMLQTDSLDDATLIRDAVSNATMDGKQPTSMYSQDWVNGCPATSYLHHLPGTYQTIAISVVPYKTRSNRETIGCNVDRRNCVAITFWLGFTGSPCSKEKCKAKVLCRLPKSQCNYRKLHLPSPKHHRNPRITLWAIHFLYYRPQQWILASDNGP